MQLLVRLSGMYNSCFQRTVVKAWFFVVGTGQRIEVPYDETDEGGLARYSHRQSKLEEVKSELKYIVCDL